MKITCSVCANEENGFCEVKKTKIKLNKRRNCKDFVLEPTKVKEKNIVKTVRLNYGERERLRREMKERLKMAKKAAANPQAAQLMPDAKHPLTGDLSRFSSTAGGGAEKNEQEGLDKSK